MIFKTFFLFKYIVSSLSETTPNYFIYVMTFWFTVHFNNIIQTSSSKNGAMVHSLTLTPSRSEPTSITAFQDPSISLGTFKVSATFPTLALSNVSVCCNKDIPNTSINSNCEKWFAEYPLRKRTSFLLHEGHHIGPHFILFANHVTKVGKRSARFLLPRIALLVEQSH